MAHIEAFEKHPYYDKSIAIMRFLAIVLIVFHHSTTVFWCWPPSVVTSMGLPQPIMALSNVAKLYGLGIFTYISGFLLARSKAEILSLPFIWHKFKKIMLPCIIAAIIYRLFFMEYACGDAINRTHLWYLPMIFIFYLLLPIIRFKNPLKMMICASLFYVICFFLHKLTLFRTFGECTNYIGYFMAGTLSFRFLTNKQLNLNAIAIIILLIFTFSWRNLTGAIGTTVCIFGIYSILRNFHTSSVLFHTKIAITLKKMVFLISEKSFHIYIIHQFVINLLLMFIPMDIPRFRPILFLLCFTFSIAFPLIFSFMYDYIRRGLSSISTSLRKRIF